jgi:hypothetical protein
LLLRAAAALPPLPVDSADDGTRARGGLSWSLPEADAEARLPLPRLVASSSSHVRASLGDDADCWIPSCCDCSDGCGDGRRGDVGETEEAEAEAEAAPPPSPFLAADLPSVDELIAGEVEFEERMGRSKRKGFASKGE